MSDDVIDSILNEEVTIPQTNSEHYEIIRTLVESMEADCLKFEKGNKSAGTRLRKSLRLLKKQSAGFVKFTLNK
jgi:hypothetical protein